MKQTNPHSLVAIVVFAVSCWSAGQALAEPSQTPTELLKGVVTELIAVAANKDASIDDRKAQMGVILHAVVNYEALSQRVVARRWKEAAEPEKQVFRDLIARVVINSYFSLLQNYTNEEVDYVSEKFKKNKYAEVDTRILSGPKRIPVKFRMMLSDGEWRIYDFVVEGISMARTYNSSFKASLKKGGLSGLNAELANELSAK